jgi:hypothetical protein
MTNSTDETTIETASARSAVLGQDFLTWLWAASERANGLFSGPSGEEFFLYMEQKITVVGGEGESMERTVASGRMSELRDARLGLRSGKKVNQAVLRIEQDRDVWQVQLRAEDFTVTGLKSPQSRTRREEGDDPDALFLEKIFLVEKCLGFLDHLFVRFLSARTGPDWDEEVARVRGWINQE